ncbi:MAG TPA: hypothetical protein VED46_08690 [Alphaproteobacteria bacterium]|nr:hypothetical protein [Alphaproteobacteria bacterium]
MEEILNSIRRIVAEDAKQRSKRAETIRTAPHSDRTAVLDLTEVVTADGTVFSIADHPQNRIEATEKARQGEAVQPRAAAAALAQEAWVSVNGAWTRAMGLENEVRSAQRDAAAAGRDVLERLAREQEGLTRRLALVSAVRDAVLAGARLISAVGEMVARDVGLPSCDLTTVTPTLSAHAPKAEASLDTVRIVWERVEAARASLIAAEQRLAAAERAWASRRTATVGGSAATDPLNLLEAEHEHLVARSAVVATQREEIVAAHALALEVHRLAERGIPA